MVAQTFRPRIGLCALQARASWGVWNDDVVFVPRDYIRTVQRAGGAPFVLPPDPEWAAEPDPVLDVLDAVILCGGVDVDPSRYDAPADPRTDPPDPERDAFEFALLRRALERDLPFLGICRGMQLMNVAHGGTLIQHLPDTVGHEDHRATPGAFGDHAVRLEPGSLAERAAGAPTTNTKSHHHQGIDRLGEGLRATGWSDVDDLVEAIEIPGRRFALGVQWHPEADATSRVITALVEEAKREAAVR